MYSVYMYVQYVQCVCLRSVVSSFACRVTVVATLQVKQPNSNSDCNYFPTYELMIKAESIIIQMQ